MLHGKFFLIQPALSIDPLQLRNLKFPVCSVNQASTKKRLLLGGYFSLMRDEDAKKRYLDTLQVIGGLDPYETEKMSGKMTLICGQV